MPYYPPLSEFREKAEGKNLVPVYREILGDLETPVSAFYKLGGGDYAYLLESVEQGEKIGQYSFLGINPSIVFKGWGKEIEITKEGATSTIQTSEDPLLYLKDLVDGFRPAQIEGLPRFWGGAVGYITYDYVRHLERLPESNPDDLGLPEALFVITDVLLIFDHLRHTIKIVANAYPKEDPISAYKEAIAKIERVVDALKSLPISIPNPQIPAPKPLVESNLTKEEFVSIVDKAKEYIRAGDILQVVPSQRFKVENLPSDPLSIYRALRRINPSPYMYLLKHKDVGIIGSSPELLVRVEDGVVETRPIAGTRPRGRSDLEDAELERSLLKDPKELSEHIMLVDLGRNDLGQVCEYETIDIPEFMVIERYSHVMHIVSSVKGRLRKDRDHFDALKACFPAGTVSGAPKIRAMEIIEELEPVRRGPYAGCVGYFSFSGNLDSCITIRTIILKDRVAYIQAGCGVVADSDPEREYEETCNKARALIKAIEMAAEGLE